MTFERNIENYGLDFEVKVSDIIKIFLNANTDIAAIPGTECLWFYYDGKPIGSVKNGKFKAIEDIKNVTGIDFDTIETDEQAMEAAKKVGTEIKMTEPTSKATLYVSTDTLSTVVENKDVIFNVVLDTNDISDALYKNPKIKITLPSQVQKIDITDAKVFYDDEITAGSFDIQGNQLIVNLTGLETKYSSSATTNGALIRIVANVSQFSTIICRTNQNGIFK